MNWDSYTNDTSTAFPTSKSNNKQVTITPEFRPTPLTCNQTLVNNLLYHNDFTLQEIIDSGVLAKNKNGLYFEKFRYLPTQSCIHLLL
jgi:hypothetical protein